MVLEKFHEIPFTNKKVACRRQAMQRVSLTSRHPFEENHFLGLFSKIKKFKGLFTFEVLYVKNAQVLTTPIRI